MTPDTQPFSGDRPEGEWSEEEWEADISALLGSLPLVEPPPGTIEMALNHRPLYAGRTMISLAVVSGLALMLWLGLGLKSQERTSFVAAELHKQILVDTNSPASVVAQPGDVPFEELPAFGHTIIEGVPAWTDPSNDLVVVQASDSALAIVGLNETELAAVIESIPRQQSIIDAVADRVNDLTSQLGFTDLGAGKS